MKSSTKILAGIFLLTLAVRLFFAFTLPEFTYESYFHLRQVDHILDTGLPLYHDGLSYGGRELRFLPFFHYFTALFALVIPIEIAAKIIPNLLLATLVITSYLIGKKITNHETGSLLAAFIAGFLPLLFFTNAFTVNALFLPLIFLTIYTFINLQGNKSLKNKKQQKYLSAYLILLLILSLTSPLTALLLIGFGIYILLSILEGKKINRAELEVILFSAFFFLWVQFLFFKQSFVEQGLSFIWQNVPSRIIVQYFPKFSVGEALVLVSIIPFLAGAVVVYRSLFQLKNQKSFLLISLVIATTILSWLRLIRFKQSLAFFSVILAILFASFYQDTEKYFQKTKLSHYKKYLLPAAIVLLLLSTVLPAVTTAITQDRPSEEEVTAFLWLWENSSVDATILATLDEGHLITYYAQRKNLIDDRFMLVKDAEQRFQDLTSLFTTRFQTQALEIAEEYDLEYFVLTPAAKEKYNLKRGFPYTSKRCFELVYDHETKIYQRQCQLEETQIT
ncbi:glycosyltransferase family 39 protein [Candidatus Woesearchaeota archaeon]|nr:glycosyltransferase family 39 protein [Candidatus Woesearchaeota archaeon]MBI2581601.1 glycosyltransferase family 39 protein [Candidatus Woesearchaeota archaeon]